MHAMVLRAQAHIPAKWGDIGDIKVSMKSEKHAGPIRVHDLT